MTFDERFLLEPIMTPSVPMPFIDNTNGRAKAQLSVNSYWIDKFLHAIVQAHQDLIITLDSADTGYSLTTSSFAIPFRGIKKVYGEDKELSFDINVKNIYDFHSFQGEMKMSVRVDANCKVYVHFEDRVELALDVDLFNAFANFTIEIEEGLTIRAHLCLIEFD
jgi:hypothetical protein